MTKRHGSLGSPPCLHCLQAEHKSLKAAGRCNLVPIPSIKMTYLLAWMVGVYDKLVGKIYTIVPMDWHKGYKYISKIMSRSGVTIFILQTGFSSPKILTCDFVVLLRLVRLSKVTQFLSENCCLFLFCLKKKCLVTMVFLGLCQGLCRLYMGFRRISMLDLCEFWSPPQKTWDNKHISKHIQYWHLFGISSHCDYSITKSIKLNPYLQKMSQLQTISKRSFVWPRIFSALRIAVSPRQDLHLNSLPDHGLGKCSTMDLLDLWNDLSIQFF